MNKGFTKKRHESEQKYGVPTSNPTFLQALSTRPCVSGVGRRFVFYNYLILQLHTSVQKIRILRHNWNNIAGLQTIISLTRNTHGHTPSTSTRMPWLVLYENMYNVSCVAIFNKSYSSETQPSSSKGFTARKKSGFQKSEIRAKAKHETVKTNPPLFLWQAKFR